MFRFWKRKPAVVPDSVGEAVSLAGDDWSRTVEALLAFQRDGDADAAMRVWRRRGDAA